MNLERIVPPLELCKLIPEGEFLNCLLRWRKFSYPWQGKTAWHVEERFAMPNKEEIYPAPTFDEILDELHKCQEDVFVKWSETSYHGWLVNAYSHGRNEDYQVHDERKTTAALKVWLKMKGIEE